METAVIIPLYNGARWIRATLKSVLTQTTPPVEVIVVDDGSEDDGREIVQSHPGVRLLENPAKGANRARRFGMQQSTAPLVAFLDHDDIWHPDHLGMMQRILACYPKAPAVHAGRRTFRTEEAPSFSEPFEQVEPLDPWLTFPVNTTGNSSSMVIRRTVLESLGGWPTRFEGVSDYYVGLLLSLEETLMKSAWKSVAWRDHARSHSHSLRLSHTQRYLTSRVHASQDALERKLATGKGNATLLSRRLRVMRAMADLVLAVLTGDRPMLRQRVRLFEAETAVEEAPLVASLCGHMAYVIYPSLGLDRRAEVQVLQEVLRGWPPGISREYLIEALTKRASGKWILGALGRRPFDGVGWRFARYYLRVRVKRRWTTLKSCARSHDRKKLDHNDLA